MLPARELVRPNMRRSVAFPAPRALVAIDMQQIFAYFAAQMAARSENRSSDEWAGARGQRRQLQARAFGGPARSGRLRGMAAGAGCGWVGTAQLAGRDGAAHATQRAGWAPKGPGLRALRQRAPDSASRPPDDAAAQRSEPLRDGTSPGNTAVRTIGSSQSRPRPATTGSDMWLMHSLSKTPPHHANVAGPHPKTVASEIAAFAAGNHLAEQ
jgi:hypothetical protein